MNIRPNGQVVTATAQLVGMKDCACEMRFVAFGGTNEDWIITFNHDVAKQEYECTVFRPDQASYLYFQDVSGEITCASGFADQSVDVVGEAKDNSGVMEGMDFQFNQAGQATVKPNGKFKNEV